MFKTLWINRNLIKQFTIREISGRYRGSLLGTLWSIITPLLMLSIYTFVFSEIFKSRWSPESENKLEFALLVFSGLIIFNIFAEMLTRAPSLIISNQNYVKKVIFPLEILPIAILGSALFHSCISFIILSCGLYFFMGTIHWTIILLPVILIPFVFLSIGLSWILSALGVYFRDIGHFITLLVQALMLLSPIFYPISMIPQNLLFIYYFNPLTLIVENTRNILVWGQLPEWNTYAGFTIVSLVIYFSGYFFFQRTKGGFADVL
ncbi:ABC transporter permease [Paenibacillus sp. MSJ-34]|uniref:ABC transporter permease n=1 Tax=Paenibacillus sp. MSJ-34 TaxID=2841529 RepID=UPI001C11EB7A|nr:ABC transporter permease [Paenibacillus sp. MSJ-34]MBU5444377.1 ABC transporter permease [Paenibacillus sp. MSJ-34]